MAARGTVGSSSGRSTSRTGAVVGRIVPEAVSVIVAVVPSSNSSRIGGDSSRSIVGYASRSLPWRVPHGTFQNCFRSGPVLWKGSSLGPSRLDDV